MKTLMTSIALLSALSGPVSAQQFFAKAVGPWQVIGSRDEVSRCFIMKQGPDGSSFFYVKDLSTNENFVQFLTSGWEPNRAKDAPVQATFLHVDGLSEIQNLKYETLNRTIRIRKLDNRFLVPFAAGENVLFNFPNTQIGINLKYSRLAVSAWFECVEAMDMVRK